MCKYDEDDPDRDLRLQRIVSVWQTISFIGATLCFQNEMIFIFATIAILIAVLVILYFIGKMLRKGTIKE